MKKTDAQKKADTALEEAVLGCVEQYRMLGGTMMADFVVIVEGLSYDEDGDPDETFVGIAFRNGMARKSVALGLLKMGEDMLLTGEREE
jgi:hypothetical protein